VLAASHWTDSSSAPRHGGKDATGGGAVITSCRRFLNEQRVTEHVRGRRLQGVGTARLLTAFSMYAASMVLPGFGKQRAEQETGLRIHPFE